MENKKKRSQIREFMDLALTFVIACIIFVSFRYFVRFPIVSGSSMEPTYHDNDRLAVFYTKNVDLNEIVVTWSESLDEYIVKRVIGVPGDTIKIIDGALYRNDTRVYEFYLNEETWNSSVNVNITLDDDQYFLMGDNRNHSTDSRTFGAIDKNDVFGKVICRVRHEEGNNYE